MDEKEFEERSDFIDDSDLELWNVTNAHFDYIQKKLVGVGAKLLVGPRGTGKTHQMRLTYINCTKDNSKPLPIFTSFSKYYHLEPFLAKVPNAIQIFHTWVLAKIALGCYSTIKDLGTQYCLFENNTDLLNESSLTVYVEKAEILRASQLNNDPLIGVLTIRQLITAIEKLTIFINRTRAVLMLDDAALSLTPDYLIEFFDIVRSLKTKIISPKASVYPGTTQYGPRFHVGQDAELVQCWLSVENPTYSDFMDSLIATRLHQYIENINSDIIEIFKYGSFGVPRAFISLLRKYRTLNENNTLSKFNSTIEQQTKFLETEYLSIKQKMSQYKIIIEYGNVTFKRIIEEIRIDNFNMKNEKNFVIGISNDSITTLKLADRMLRFLIEAGLLYEEAPVKHGSQVTGEKREYRRFIPHLLFLIQNRTFSKGHSSSISEMLSAIKAKPRKHPLRRSLSNILTPLEIQHLELDLPHCQSCNTPRLLPEQRFCHSCGTELINPSTFEECLKISVENLPLTSWEKRKVQEIGLMTIADFMILQDPGTELRKIHQVGEIRSNKIYQEVIKSVNEFLA